MVTLDDEAGMPPVGLPVELAQCQPDVKRWRDRLAMRAQPLDRADDLGIEPEARVEGEVPAVRCTEADRAHPVLGDRPQDLTGGVDGIPR